MRIGVIGAGHAGVEAAGQARRHGAEVVLFSSEPVPPYFRPRVVALAFGQVEADGIHLKPQSWYREQGIDLRLDAEVTCLDASAKCVTAGGRAEQFDALIIATGAAPARLPFLQEFPKDVIALWGTRESLAIRERLPRTRRLVILGGGVSGVESALYARQAGLDVTMVEKMDRPMSLQFGVNAGAVLVHRLETAGIRVLTERHAVAVSRRDGRLRVDLSDATELPCDLIITTAGTTRKLAVFEQAGLRVDKGILVDEHLQTSMPGVFACGDIAQRDNVSTATVVRANRQGRCAGDNAVAYLQGREPARAPEPVAPLLFQHADLELQSIGPAGGADLEERAFPDNGPTVYRSVLLENGLLRGVQMVGSRDGFRRLADALGRPWQPGELPHAH
jgi:nitrite reductase (NADH) large subunit